MSDTVLIWVDLFQTPPNLLGRVTRRPQRWRWRARNGLNNRVLAVSSEAYVNQGDCLDAIEELFAENSNVYLREREIGDIALRLAKK